MTTIERNPDFDLSSDEEAPDGCFVLEGKHLMQTARCGRPVPYGRATMGRVTVGLVIREIDRAEMLAWIEAREVKEGKLGRRLV